MKNANLKDENSMISRKITGIVKLQMKKELLGEGLPALSHSIPYDMPLIYLSKMKAKNEDTKLTPKNILPRNERPTGLIGPLAEVRERMPIVFESLNSNSSQDKLAPLSLLDDTLMNLSIVLVALQKRISQEDEILQPETIKALTEVSKEIRALTQLKFDVARELSEDQVRRVRLAMEVEKHANYLCARS